VTEPRTVESTCLAWYCGRCRCAYKVEPPVFAPGCGCTSPVAALRPTRITQVHAPESRPLHVVDVEEARLRNLLLARQPVRVAYEGRVVKAWTTTAADGEQRMTWIVQTPDGRRHAVDLSQPGVHVESATTKEN